MQKFKFRFRWRRQLKVTREGRYFLGLTIGVGLASIYTGNNLLFILFGVLLALILISGILSELTLKDLIVKRKMPTRAYVGQPHLIEIEIFNRKKKFPSYAIEVEDIRIDQPADKRCFFLKISPESTQIAVYRRTPQKRGSETHVAFRIATRFPFGLFEKSKRIEATDEIIVYPTIYNVSLLHLRAQQKSQGLTQLFRGVSDDLFGIRPYREGDDPRLIHWRKSATAGFWVIREHSIAENSDIYLEINNLSHLLNRPNEDHERIRWLKHFENHISDVASRSVAYIKQGNTVVIRTTSGTTIRSNLRLGSTKLLRFLALLQPQTAHIAPSAHTIKTHNSSMRIKLPA